MSERPNVLIIGAGGVAAATAHKAAQHGHELGDICIASRTRRKCDAIVESIAARTGPDRDFELGGTEIDAKNADALGCLIEEKRARIVLNVGYPRNRCEGAGEKPAPVTPSPSLTPAGPRLSRRSLQASGP